MRQLSTLLLVTLVFSSVYGQQNTVVINEFMADNTSVITDESGKYEDWIELYNCGKEPVNIGGWFITDDFDEPRKFRIREGSNSTIIQPNTHLLLWADDDWEEGILHLEFKFSRQGEQIAIFGTDGKTLIDSVSFKMQQPNHSMGRLPDGASEWVEFEDSTPGTANQK